MNTITALHNTQLCRHYLKNGCYHRDCKFAHQLSDLKPPDESDGLYTKVWKDVNRWYGQELSEDIIETIENYFDEEKTRRMTIPKWAIACMIWYKDYVPTPEDHADDDYGLQEDIEDLLSTRRVLPKEIDRKVPKAIVAKLEHYKASISSATATTYRARSRTPPWQKGKKTNYGANTTRPANDAANRPIWPDGTPRKALSRTGQGLRPAPAHHCQGICHYCQWKQCSRTNGHKAEKCCCNDIDCYADASEDLSDIDVPVISRHR